MHDKNMSPNKLKTLAHSSEYWWATFYLEGTIQWPDKQVLCNIALQYMPSQLFNMLSRLQQKGTHVHVQLCWRNDTNNYMQTYTHLVARLNADSSTSSARKQDTQDSSLLSNILETAPCCDIQVLRKQLQTVLYALAGQLELVDSSETLKCIRSYITYASTIYVTIQKAPANKSIQKHWPSFLLNEKERRQQYSSPNQHQKKRMRFVLHCLICVCLCMPLEANHHTHPSQGQQSVGPSIQGEVSAPPSMNNPCLSFSPVDAGPHPSGSSLLVEQSSDVGPILPVTTFHLCPPRYFSSSFGRAKCLWQWRTARTQFPLIGQSSDVAHILPASERKGTVFWH